jgi:hypothetical protein
MVVTARGLGKPVSIVLLVRATPGLRVVLSSKIYLTWPDLQASGLRPAFCLGFCSTESFRRIKIPR